MKYYLFLSDPDGTYQYGGYHFQGRKALEVDKVTYDHFLNNPLFQAQTVQGEAKPVQPVVEQTGGAFEVADLPSDNRKSAAKKKTPTTKE